MTMERLRRSINLVLCVTCVAVGLAAMVWMVETKAEPPVRAAFEKVPQVAVTRIEPTTQQVPVLGRGTVRPKRQVKIVPQVSGKLVYAHEDLAQGKIIPEGELLFEIDPTIYEARLRQAQAEVRGLQAALERHEQELKNLDERIITAEQMVVIEERDYLTTKKLYEEESVGTQRDVDQLYQKYLRQKDALVQLRNRQSMIPHLKLETQAQLDAALPRVKQAQHDLDSTKIHCPFDARVEVVGAHESQVVTAHLSIATLTDMSAFEISVGIDPRELRWLDEAIRPAALTDESDNPTPVVKVTWSLPGQAYTWRGHVTRFERVDEMTRTARLVVEVRDVEMKAEVIAGPADTLPTLSIGMHCRAELPAAPLDDSLVVPRHAIYHDQWVYVFESDVDAEDPSVGRLGRRAINMLRTFGDDVLVDYAGADSKTPCELAAGDRVIVSPLVRPVVGMKVALRNEAIADMDATPITVAFDARAEGDAPNVSRIAEPAGPHTPLLSQLNPIITRN